MDAKSVVLQKLNRVLHLNNAFTIHSNSSEETSKKYVTNLNFSIQKYWLRLCIKFESEAYHLNDFGILFISNFQFLHVFVFIYFLPVQIYYCSQNVTLLDPRPKSQSSIYYELTILNDVSMAIIYFVQQKNMTKYIGSWIVANPLNLKAQVW